MEEIGGFEACVASSEANGGSYQFVCDEVTSLPVRRSFGSPDCTGPPSLSETHRFQCACLDEPVLANAKTRLCSVASVSCVASANHVATAAVFKDVYAADYSAAGCDEDHGRAPLYSLDVSNSKDFVEMYNGACHVHGPQSSVALGCDEESGTLGEFRYGGDACDGAPKSFVPHSNLLCMTECGCASAPGEGVSREKRVLRLDDDVAARASLTVDRCAEIVAANEPNANGATLRESDEGAQCVAELQMTAIASIPIAEGGSDTTYLDSCEHLGALDASPCARGEHVAPLCAAGGIALRTFAARGADESGRACEGLPDGVLDSSDATLLRARLPHAPMLRAALRAPIGDSSRPRRRPTQLPPHVRRRRRFSAAHILLDRRALHGHPGVRDGVDRRGGRIREPQARGALHVRPRSRVRGRDDGSARQGASARKGCACEYA